jgi:hypothetical protein
MHQSVMVAIALSLMAGVVPAAAQTGAGAKSRPTNLSAYSLRYWPQNALLRGQTARATTPYGILTCTSIGPSHRRQCSLR